MGTSRGRHGSVDGDSISSVAYIPIMDHRAEHIFILLRMASGGTYWVKSHNQFTDIWRVYCIIEDPGKRSDIARAAGKG